MGINHNKMVIQERRQKIWTLITRGMKGYEIAKELGVDPGTVSRDINYLVAQSQNYLNLNDDYYIETGSMPPRFLAYRRARWEKLDEWGKKTCEDVDKTITQDELYFGLKWELKTSLEQRYQRDKRNWLFHDLSCYMRGLGEYDHGCSGSGCIPECRFYPEYGRIEDDEVIEDHNRLVESLRQKNAIVEPPPESELLKLAKIYRFSSLEDYRQKTNVTL